MLNNKFKVKPKHLLASLLFFPYFVPQSIVLMQQYGTIWLTIYNVLAIVRCLIAGISVGIFIFKKLNPNMLTMLLILYELSILIVCYLNKSLTFQFSITNCLTYIGFACFIQILDKGRKEKLLNTLIFFFGVMCFFGVASIIIFPNGFNHASVKSQAIYFLGSKNNSFFYFFTYALLKAYKAERYYKKINLSLIIACSVFIICTLICDSMNGSIMMLLILFYLVIRRTNVSLKTFLTPKKAVAYVCVAAALIEPLTSGKFDWMFNMIGRESNFSMRTFIWSSAFDLISLHPFIGNGKDGDLIIFKGQTQAHNIFIDYATKYGVITLAIFVLMLIVVAVHLSKGTNKRLKQTMSIFYLIFFIHSLFDSVTIPFIIVLLYYCYISGSDNKLDFLALTGKQVRNYSGVLLI